MWKKRGLTNGVNNLVDHDFTEFKLLVLFAVADVLGDHGNAIVVIAEAFASAVHGTALLVIVVIQCADAVGLADSTVTHCASLVVLVAKPERLQE
jgi:hypothetical protein